MKMSRRVKRGESRAVALWFCCNFSHFVLELAGMETEMDGRTEWKWRDSRITTLVTPSVVGSDCGRGSCSGVVDVDSVTSSASLSSVA
jgi:hypothetical protein